MLLTIQCKIKFVIDPLKDDPPPPQSGASHSPITIHQKIQMFYLINAKPLIADPDLL
jgi:hypothetical protein